MMAFVVIEASTSENLEKKLNEWVKSLPPKTKIRRTQIGVTSGRTVALINYESPESSS